MTIQTLERVADIYEQRAIKAYFDWEVTQDERVYLEFRRWKELAQVKREKLIELLEED